MALTRAQLNRYVDDVLEAMVSHDARRLPLAAYVRYTQNTQKLKLTEGLWRTATGRDPGGNYFTDPEAGQVGFFGAIGNGEGRAIVCLRLRFDEGDRLAEIETCVVPDGGAMFEPESVCTPRSAFREDLAPSQRRTRHDLIRTANLYFDGIELNNGNIVPLSADVSRIENGVCTANSKEVYPEMGPMAELACLGVAEQLNRGLFEYIEAIRDRRYLVADEERGVVFGVFFADYPGSDEGEGTPAIPRTTAMICEAFKIRDGLIEQVESVGTLLPYGTSSGWR